MSDVPDPVEFSLTNGGPTFRLLSRFGLTRPLSRRTALATLITWLPLMFLSAVQGNLLSDRVRLPFLLDLAQYARFLIAIPLLFIAESVVDRWLRKVVHNIEHTGFVTGDESRFRIIIDKAIRMRDSGIAELIMLMIVIIAVVFTPVKGPILYGISTWVQSDGIFSAAGWWYRIVSIPIYQFVLYRWLWRYTIWVILLKRISGLNLRLAPAHPDRVGGLEFLVLGQRAFALIVFTISAVLASIIADAMIYKDEALVKYQNLIIVYIILALIIFLLPLFFFSSKLKTMRLNGLMQYDALGYHYTMRFHKKWVAPDKPDETFLGTSDIQSLADLGAAYEVVRSARLVPITPQVALIIAFSAALPMAALLLLEIPVMTLLEITYKLLRTLMG